ncbi:MAG: aldo/keto reductase [Candidatus Thiodiazotropha weberae]|nr:aldo/keto reductase [Candidatus Thiodiazotropha lotti]MCG8012613.1 aldo/keto reductase [Candidatus Thiodiazotropha lotti]MCW4212084.1 aldo/keto reductase [Candidatus Thiodiazotropha lotti]MCW4215886.1 aldo/keto reductase [Candidatus Thiodiazotropha lotti]
MKYRTFGKTGLKISEISYGSWSISGDAYGTVSVDDAHRALSIANDHGCNFIDTASVYGSAESYIGKYFKANSNRHNWYLATKYSGQKDGFNTTLVRQLVTLKTDYIDFYQLHWVPNLKEHSLYEDLLKAKESGKIRFIGMSAYSESDIDLLINHYHVDGVQLPFNLLQPYPYLSKSQILKAHNIGILVRSPLHSGYLSGRYKENHPITDTNDLRSKNELIKHNAIVRKANSFTSIVKDNKSLLEIAASYPLTYDSTSSVLLGTKSPEQADYNFGKIPDITLTEAELEAIFNIQKRQGLHPTYAKKLLKYLYKIIKRSISKL